MPGSVGDLARTTVRTVVRIVPIAALSAAGSWAFLETFVTPTLTPFVAAVRAGVLGWLRSVGLPVG